MPEKLMVKNYIAETKAVEDKRILNVTITTDTVDRDGDIVEPKGIKTANYRRNNAVLFGHDYRGLPIAKGENLVKTEHGITADVIFPAEGIYPLADTVYNMGKQGFIKAWSIGFIPIKTEDIVDEDEKDSNTEILKRKGRRIKSCDLLEFSACAVGCNPDALTNMIAKGIDIESLKEAGFIEIEEEKIEVNKDKPEEIINKPEETEEFIHIPVRSVADFVDGSFKTITIDAGKGIKAVIGKLKSDPQGSTHVQKYIFDKSKGWTLASAQAWVNDHKKEYEEIKLEELNLDLPIPDIKMGFDIDSLIKRIYEITEENNNLKEKTDKLELEKKDLELKIGAVLNKKNKQDLKDAQEKIQNVLDSAEPIEENSLEIEEAKDNKDDDTGIDIEDSAKNDKGIDEAKLEEIIEKTFEGSNKSIKEHFNKKLNYIMGRVR
jgi:phage head maturation protease